MRLKCKFCEATFARLIEWKWHRDESHGGVADYCWIHDPPVEAATFTDGEGI